MGSGGLTHLGMLLRSLGCVWDPARFPWGSELGLDLAPMPRVLDDAFRGTRCCGAGLGGTGLLWAQHEAHGGAEGTVRSN